MNNYTIFLDSFFEQIAKANIDVSALPLDHIAYQASSSDEYVQLKPRFAELGKEAHEEVIGGRRVAVFKLNKPIEYKNYSIQALELIEPKQGQVCESGYQHAEFVVDQPFEFYMEKYPDLSWDTSSMSRSDFAHLKLNFENGLTLKFLKSPILELVSKV